MKEDSVQQIHHIAYRLVDTKATIIQDISVNVGGVQVQGREGEIINMPLWVGEILQRSRAIRLEMPDAVSELKQSRVREQLVGEYQLSSLDPQFYIRLKSQMDELGERDRDDVEGIMMELVRLRRGKIVRLADSSKLTGEMKSKITIEEKAFFEAIHQESRRFEERVGYNEQD